MILELNLKAAKVRCTNGVEMCCVSEHDVLSPFYTKVNIYVPGLDLRNAIKIR